MHSPEIQQRIDSARMRGANGTLSLEEMRDMIILLRDNRSAPSTYASPGSKVKSPKAPPRAADDMLGELGV